MLKLVRSKVSQKKRRLILNDGWDLDMSYITNNIIAMGFPAIGVESMYRNPRLGKKGVVAYLDSRHPKHYRVYNICAERDYQYDPDVFHGASECFPFFDHNPAPMLLISGLCMSASSWLNQHPENVVVVHCKAGKGRTGFIICCLLLYLRICKTAAEAINLFTKKRVESGRTLNQPSQIRYVYYWEQLMRLQRTTDISKGLNLPDPDKTTRYLRALAIVNASPNWDRIKIDLYQNGVFVCRKVAKSANSGDFLVVYTQQLAGDIKILIKSKVGMQDEADEEENRGESLTASTIDEKTIKHMKTMVTHGPKSKILARYWFNTEYVSDTLLELRKHEWDVAYATSGGFMTGSSYVRLGFAASAEGAFDTLSVFRHTSSPADPAVPTSSSSQIVLASRRRMYNRSKSVESAASAYLSPSPFTSSSPSKTKRSERKTGFRPAPPPPPGALKEQEEKQKENGVPVKKSYRLSRSSSRKNNGPPPAPPFVKSDSTTTTPTTTNPSDDSKSVEKGAITPRKKGPLPGRLRKRNSIIQARKTRSFSSSAPEPPVLCDEDKTKTQPPVPPVFYSPNSESTHRRVRSSSSREIPAPPPYLKSQDSASSLSAQKMFNTTGTMLPLDDEELHKAAEDLQKVDFTSVAATTVPTTGSTNTPRKADEADADEEMDSWQDLPHINIHGSTKKRHYSSADVLDIDENLRRFFSMCTEAEAQHEAENSTNSSGSKLSDSEDESWESGGEEKDGDDKDDNHQHNHHHPHHHHHHHPHHHHHHSHHSHSHHHHHSHHSHSHHHHHGNETNNERSTAPGTGASSDPSTQTSHATQEKEEEIDWDALMRERGTSVGMSVQDREAAKREITKKAMSLSGKGLNMSRTPLPDAVMSSAKTVSRSHSATEQVTSHKLASYDNLRLYLRHEIDALNQQYACRIHVRDYSNVLKMGML